MLQEAILRPFLFLVSHGLFVEVEFCILEFFLNLFPKLTES